MNLAPHRIAPLCTLFLLFALVPPGARAQSQASAMGSWEFDEARKEVYVTSLQATQRGGSMSEIAVQMGLARWENSILTFAVDARGPHLIRTDKTTGDAVRQPITLRRDGQDLLVTEEDSGTVLRLRPVDKDHLTLVEEARRLSVPLKRR